MMVRQRTAVLALVVGLVMISCSDDAEVSDVAQVATFSFETDDLCDWVSVDEISEFVSSQFDWDGDVSESEAPAAVAQAEERGNVACSWTLGGYEAGHITVFAPTTLEVGDETYDYDDVAGTIVDGPVLGDPSLSTGVAFFQEPYSNTAFGVPATGSYLIASFELPDFESPQSSWDDYWDRWFTVADRIVGELGWT